MSEHIHTYQKKGGRTERIKRKRRGRRPGKHPTQRQLPLREERPAMKTKGEGEMRRTDR